MSYAIVSVFVDCVVVCAINDKVGTTVYGSHDSKFVKEVDVIDSSDENCAIMVCVRILSYAMSVDEGITAML